MKKLFGLLSLIALIAVAVAATAAAIAYLRSKRDEDYDDDYDDDLYDAELDYYAEVDPDEGETTDALDGAHPNEH